MAVGACGRAGLGWHVGSGGRYYSHPCGAQEEVGHEAEVAVPMKKVEDEVEVASHGRKEEAHKLTKLESHAAAQAVQRKWSGRRGGQQLWRPSRPGALTGSCGQRPHCQQQRVFHTENWVCRHKRPFPDPGCSTHTSLLTSSRLDKARKKPPSPARPTKLAKRFPFQLPASASMTSDTDSPSSFLTASSASRGSSKSTKAKPGGLREGNPKNGMQVMAEDPKIRQGRGGLYQHQTAACMPQASQC